MSLMIRCSQIGKIMTEPKTLKEGLLSVGAKTYIRELAAQEIFGVDFQITSKYFEKGIETEPECIALLNRVRGMSLEKNTERRSNDYITGECDLYDQQRNRGHDTKSAWSIATFPICQDDIKTELLKQYEWQMRGYMMLWDASEWEVNYCLVNTPERLIGYEPQSLHFVDHIPERLRLTTVTFKRDLEKEAAIAEKVKAARDYYMHVITYFDAEHQ
jgi:hypothetical protein